MVSFRAIFALAAAVSIVAACVPSTPSLKVAQAPRAETPFERFELGREGGVQSRDAWFWDQRSYPTGSIPYEVHRRAAAAELARGRVAAADGDEWVELGPRPLRDLAYGSFGSRQNASGRLMTVAPHPTDPNIVLVGAAQGGIWKSTDRGATFRPVGENALPAVGVSVLRYDPSDPDVVYAGTGEAYGSIGLLGAGIVKSNDGGETWELLPPRGDGWDFEFASITAIAVDTRDPNLVWASTATILPFIAPPVQPPSGVFRSEDGGMSWTLVYAAKRHAIDGENAPSAGVIDLEHGGPSAPDLLFAAEYYGGVVRSIDGGASWTRVTPMRADGLGRLPDAVPAVEYYDGNRRNYQRSTRLAPQAGFPEFRRIELGVSPADPQTIYAGYDTVDNRLDRNANGVYDAGDFPVRIGMLFKSTDGGESWSWLGSWRDGVPDYCSPQCHFDNVVAVNSDDANEVVIAGNANYATFVPDPVENPTRILGLPWKGMVYRSLDGGASWTDLTPHCSRLATTPRTISGTSLPVYDCLEMDPRRAIHPDSHNAAWAADGSLWVATDGGLHRTADGQVWENLNDSLGTLQFYRIALHPTDPNIMLGGMQDNSAGYWDGATWEGWGAGDGTIAMFDPIDPRWVYLGSQFLIHRHAGGGVKDLFDESWSIGVFGIDQMRLGERTSFVPVITMDRRDPRILYASTTHAIYRTEDRGDTWIRLTDGDLDGTPMTIDVAGGDSDLVWVGTATGRVYAYELAGRDDGRRRIARRASPNHDWAPARLTDVTRDLPDRSVVRVLAPSADANLVYAVFTGYDANTPETPGKVFVSRDRGASWENVSSGLPDVPVSALAADPHDPSRLWLGTDIGVFATTDGGISWRSDRGVMPVVSVLDLQYNPVTGYLVAATHGRGVWRKAIGAAAASRESAVSTAQ